MTPKHLAENVSTLNEEKKIGSSKRSESTIDLIGNKMKAKIAGTKISKASPTVLNNILVAKELKLIQIENKNKKS
ncbi:hypothetical protein BpHYR1_020382 [Brachionus plicatilis]|uniref:Uncharacterized protein n=1 Tax=Brachionus plicatilis TaxID=10195 RepID=A0A3M7QWX1_BRAPC|nr:hypothetical protein BpHYR1_020382 [Brachionus plicatilis]